MSHGFVFHRRLTYRSGVTERLTRMMDVLPTLLAPMNAIVIRLVDAPPSGPAMARAPFRPPVRKRATQTQHESGGYRSGPAYLFTSVYLASVRLSIDWPGTPSFTPWTERPGTALR